MHCTLRDWNRIWHLSCSHEVNFCPGTPVTDLPTALAIISHLITDRANLSALNGLLSSAYPIRERAVSSQLGPLLLDVKRLLAQRDCILLRGADARFGGGSSRRAPEEIELEPWNFAPAEEPAPESPATEEPIPSIRFTGAGEAPVTLGFRHGSEPHAGPVFAHGHECGPAFAFTGAAEGTHGFDYSTSVKERS